MAFWQNQKICFNNIFKRKKKNEEEIFVALKKIY